MKNKTIRVLFLTIIQFLAFELSFSSEQPFQSFSILEIPLFILIILLTRNVCKNPQTFEKKQLVPCILLAAVFSFFMNAGHSLDLYGDLTELSFTPENLLKTLPRLTGYMIFFFMSISFIFLKLNKTEFRYKNNSSEKKGTNFFFRFLMAKPFLTSFVTLFCLSLPAMIITYPGILNGDIYFQIAQGFGLENRKDWHVISPPKPELYKVIDGETVKVSTKLSNYHPVAHTMLLRECLILGYKLFGTDNAGLFLLVLLQNLLLDLVLAYCVKIMIEQFRIKPLWCTVFLAYYILYPGISGQMTTVSKEGIYIPFLILVIMQIIVLINKKTEKTLFHLGLVLLGTIGVILFRNEGKFLLAVSFFLIFLLKPGRRSIFGASLCFTVAFALLYELVLLPAWNVAPGSVREMLSVPVQQTARYVRDAGESITELERKHIDAVWDYDLLAEKYNPDISDPVKQTYKQTATISDLKRYTFTWFDMFLKRPDIYLLATMNNYYLYFYPKNTGSLLTNFGFASGEMFLANKNCAEINLDLHFPTALNGIRNWYEKTREWIFSLPLLRSFHVSAFFVWGLFLYETYCITKRNRDAFLIGIPMLIQVLIFLTGPTNGNYARYIFMLKACLPVIIIFGLSMIRTDSSETD